MTEAMHTRSERTNKRNAEPSNMVQTHGEHDDEHDDDNDDDASVCRVRINEHDVCIITGAKRHLRRRHSRRRQPAGAFCEMSSLPLTPRIRVLYVCACVRVLTAYATIQRRKHSSKCCLARPCTSLPRQLRVLRATDQLSLPCQWCSAETLTAVEHSRLAAAVAAIFGRQ